MAKVAASQGVRLAATDRRDDDMVSSRPHRLEAARLLGIAEVPVHIARGLSPAQAKAYRLTDNRADEKAEWNELLWAGARGSAADGIDLLLTGFDNEELERMLQVRAPGAATTRTTSRRCRAPGQPCRRLWALARTAWSAGTPPSGDRRRLLGKASQT